MHIQSTRKPAVHVAVVRGDQRLKDPALDRLVRSPAAEAAVEDDVFQDAMKRIGAGGSLAAAHLAGFSKTEGLWRSDASAFDSLRLGGAQQVVGLSGLPSLGHDDAEKEALTQIRKMGADLLKDQLKGEGYGLHVDAVTTLWQGVGAIRKWNEQGLSWESSELSGKALAGGLKVASECFPNIPLIKTASDSAGLIVMVFGIVAGAVTETQAPNAVKTDRFLIAFEKPPQGEDISP